MSQPGGDGSRQDVEKQGFGLVAVAIHFPQQVEARQGDEQSQAEQAGNAEGKTGDAAHGRGVSEGEGLEQGHQGDGRGEEAEHADGVARSQGEHRPEGGEHRPGKGDHPGGETSGQHLGPCRTDQHVEQQHDRDGGVKAWCQHQQPRSGGQTGRRGDVGPAHGGEPSLPHTAPQPLPIGGCREPQIARMESAGQEQSRRPAGVG